MESANKAVLLDVFLKIAMEGVPIVLQVQYYWYLDFILSDDGECEEGIKHCVKYNTKGATKVCENCQTGFSMINNMCLKNKILGC